MTPTIAATVPADTAIIRIEGIFIAPSPVINGELDATGLTKQAGSKHTRQNKNTRGGVPDYDRKIIYVRFTR